MSETVILMIREIIEVCLIPLLGVLVTYLVKYINTKSKELEANTDNELAKKAAMEKLDKNKDASKEKSKE